MRVRVTEAKIMADLNLAILRLEVPVGTPPLPLAPQNLALNLFDPVYLIGYPTYDSRQDPDAAVRAAGGVYKVKRLQPGIVLELPEERTTFDHSCFALGGNGGSPVVDLATATVVGLHWGGWKKSYGRG